MGVEQRVKETVERNNRFYTNEKGEIKTENEQLKEWLIIANKENERLKEENTILKQTMSNNSLLINENALLKSIIKEVREWAKKYSCQFTNDDGELVVSEISFNIQARPCDLFKILDKEKE